MKTTDDFVLFWGGELSNWFSCNFTNDFGVTFNCVEQYMMYMKGQLFEDYETRDQIILEDDPRVQKALGRKVKNFNDTTWDEFKQLIVFNGCFMKFDQNIPLKEFLINTKDRKLVECSPHDNIWGIGMHQDDPRAIDPQQWQGQNLLGKILETVRDKLNGKTTE